MSILSLQSACTELALTFQFWRKGNTGESYLLTRSCLFFGLHYLLCRVRVRARDEGEVRVRVRVRVS